MKKTLMGLAAAATGAALMCGCGDAAQSNKAQGAIALKYANFPSPSTFPCVQMERFKAEVEARAEGRLKITTYPGGQLLDAKAILDGVINGTADIGNFAMSYQPGRFPVTEALDLPHFFPDAKTATRSLEAVVDAFDPAEFKDVVVLSVFTCPPKVVMSKDPVNTLADLKGMSIRTAGTDVEVFKRIGGVPVAMPQSEVPEALQKGLVSGNLSSAEVLKDLNYAEPCPNVYAADLGVVSFAVVMNKRAFERLPKDLQETFKTLGREQSRWTAEYVDNHAEEAIAWGKAERGLKVTVPSDSDRAALREAAAPLFDEYVGRVKAKGVDGKAVLGKIEGLRDEG
ncbi:MAG: TRAP transporter substrate-binding protein [Kiritimatiellaeota bacterium]|nr:TRAP transporter substrate-binding protein [Kiritimatiellota bacterium]